MDKNTIKKFAVRARCELISRVSQKALQYGITADEIVDGSADSINGKVLSAEERKQRKALIAQVQEKGYEEVMEEVAYTWFNRFSALRFMEVNGYLPSHVRVFTDEENNFKPQILAEAIHLDMPGLDMEKVFAYKEANQTEELYKYLLITQCNALNSILPRMFQHISDYTELLFPDNLLREGSVLQQMIQMIPEEDWKDAVQIMGWLYQYYNAEKKDEVFAALKKNVKITKENIPAATQLFTPDWIVRYMVENSLGRLWVEGHPNDDLKASWRYYLEEAEQEPEVEAQLAEIRKGYAAMKPEEIKVIDPCCGSGHILVYMFDVLMQIYESYGFTTREAVASIVRNNIYGLDIDDRAAQIAYFAVMMKARQYDRRFFSHVEQPNVYAIQESNHINSSVMDYYANVDPKLKEAMGVICEELRDAKEYGSILTTSQQDWNLLYDRFDAVIDEHDIQMEDTLEQILPLVRVAEMLAQKYDVVVTNPPYMGSSGMSGRLAEYVKKHYPDSKGDLSTVCMEKTLSMCDADGYMAMINIPVWMFLSSYGKLRENLLENNTIINMVHPGRGIFGSDFGTTSFIICKKQLYHYKGYYRRLFEVQGEVKGIEEREKAFFSGKGKYFADQSNFSKIPGSPVAYWASEKFVESYLSKTLEYYGVAKSGLQTGNNELFLKQWFEVDFPNIAFGMERKEEYFLTKRKWIPQIKGGEFRKWYGNLDYIVNWLNDGQEIKSCPSCRLNAMGNDEWFFKQGITWSHTTSGGFGTRYLPGGCLFNVEAPTYFVKAVTIEYVLAFLNSCVSQYYLNALNSTLHYLVGNILNLPLIKTEIENENRISNNVQVNIKLSQFDWDSFETSWDFQTHPLASKSHLGVDGAIEMESVYRFVKQDYEQRFQELKSNEEELNHIFIDIYGLQDELTPEVEDKDVTVYRYFDEKEDIPESMGKSKYALTKRDMIVSFISYAVGCMFGRYSLDVEGLAFAGGEWDPGKYTTFPADQDNIIPICDDEYFEDDIVGRFVKFVETVYGTDTLEENLRFIADALGGKGQPREVIRSYFLNDFFKDHCKTYQKRPIYWLFDSGKKNGFKALIYMHRYQPDTIARIRTDYVHEQQGRYRTAMEDLERRMEGAASGERVKLNKALTRLKDQDAELHAYEEKIHHLADQMISIDLDDGVKHNYAIFQDVLAKIK